MENKQLNPENIGIINVAALSKIAAKQDANMHMLSFLIAETTETKEDAKSIFDRYSADASRHSEIIANEFKNL